MKSEFDFDSVILRLKKATGFDTDSAIAAALGMSTGAFGNRKKSGSIPYAEIVSLALSLNLNSDYLFTGRESAPSDEEKAKAILEIVNSFTAYRMQIMAGEPIATAQNEFVEDYNRGISHGSIDSSVHALFPTISINQLIRWTDLARSWSVTYAQDRPEASYAAKQNNGDLVQIPCLNIKGSAGYGNHVHEEHAVGHFEVSRAWVRNVLNCEPGKVDIIIVDGPSMEPTLEDGELVLVDRRCNRFDNDAVYAIQYDGKLRIKRVQLRFDGSVMVKSDNPSFDPELLTAEQSEGLRVIGKVLPWKFGKFRL